MPTHMSLHPHVAQSCMAQRTSESTSPSLQTSSRPSWVISSSIPGHHHQTLSVASCYLHILLLTLSSSQSIPYHPDLLYGLMNNLWTKSGRLSNLQSECWSDSCSCTRTLSMTDGRTNTSEVDHIRPQHVLQCLNGALFLPICLRMERNTELYLPA